MQRWFTAVFGCVLLLLGTAQAQTQVRTEAPAQAKTQGQAQSRAATSPQTEEVDNATSVLRQFVDIPENAIPGALLRQAYGIAVIPSVFKIGFMLAVRHGKGVMSVRTADGGWSNPAFVSLTGGSIGWQAGASSTDIILVFKSQRSVDRIADGEFTVGADASVAAGPVGRSAGASTNLTFSAEVYSYSRARGLFAGVSIDGARLGIDEDSNWLFYDTAGLDATTILKRGEHGDIPLAGQRFVYTLDRYMPPSADQFNYGADTRAERAASGAGGGQPDNDPYSQGQTTPYHPTGHSVSVRQNTGGSGSAPTGNSANRGDYGSRSGRD